MSRYPPQPLEHAAGEGPEIAMQSALEISRKASLKPIADIAAEIGIPPWLVRPYGEHVAKIDLAAIDELADRPRARDQHPLLDRHDAFGLGQLRAKLSPESATVRSGSYSPATSLRRRSLPTGDFGIALTNV